jgi:hypothetical protein
MFRNPFDGARAKIERSHLTFNELIAAEARYNQPQTITISLVPQDNGDTKGYGQIAALPTLADEAIVADIVGAFRSSLDIAVSQACRVRGATDVSNTYFAFAGSESDWDGNAPNRMKNADSLIRSVVRSFQPWKVNGNQMLYALSKLVAGDKHVDLIAIATSPGEMTIDGLCLSRGDGLLSRFEGVTPIWDSTQPTLLFTVGSPAKVDVAGPCILRAKFGIAAVHGLQAQPLIPLLNAMGAMCEEIINTIEAAVT